MAAADGLCPFHPSTFEQLPMPLPANISDAIQSVERILSNVTDPTNVVSIAIYVDSCMYYTVYVGIENNIQSSS